MLSIGEALWQDPVSHADHGIFYDFKPEDHFRFTDCYKMSGIYPQIGNFALGGGKKKLAIL